MFRKFISRPYIVGFALGLQVIWLFVSLALLSANFRIINFIVQVVSVVAILLILNQPNSPAFKLPWVVLILTAPIFGGAVYFLTSGKEVFRRQQDRYLISSKWSAKYTDVEHSHAVQSIKKENPNIAGQFHYLERKGFPVYNNTECNYYPMANDAFPDLLEALKGARRYIFLEYFIITQTSMWEEILKILEEKTGNGLDVRVIYDDVATMTKLPRRYLKELEMKGIRCIAFNPFIPVVTASMNNRDHRKIAVIDGEIAFTGGFNLSDEYINRTHPFGTWKDAGVRLKGEGAYGLAIIFLTMWNAAKEVHEDYDQFRPALANINNIDSFVQPYAHEPFTGSQIVGEIYRNMINQANDYLYIYTPYLIPDPETLASLNLAADRGVDVRLIVPCIPDKKVIHQLTKAHYPQLVEHGVMIYEYTPGFVHSKCLVCDDKIASIGSANLDYRSFYHSYEVGCLFYNSVVISELKNDFMKTLLECGPIKSVSTRLHIFSGVYYAILRVFSPLL